MTNKELADALDEKVVVDNHMNEYQRGIIREAANRLRQIDKPKSTTLTGKLHK